MEDKKMDAVATKVIEWMESTEGFVVEQAPDVVQQLLDYSFYRSIIWLLLICACLLALNLGCFYWRKLITEDTAEDWGPTEKQECREKVYLIQGVFSFLFFLIGFIHFLDILKIVTAPKLFLLEYFRAIL